MDDELYLADSSEKGRKKRRVDAKPPKAPETRKAITSSAGTRTQRKKGAKSPKAIAASKSARDGVDTRQPKAAAPQKTKARADGEARAKKRRSGSAKTANDGARPNGSAASTEVSLKGDDAWQLRSFSSAAEAVAEVPKLGKALGAIRTQYRKALQSVLASLYACACYYREDDDALVLFCLDPYWNDATSKPSRGKPDDILRFVIRRALVGARKEVNDRVHKYTRALLPSWEARRTPDEVLALLRKVGIANAAKGLAMKEVAEKPAAANPSEEGDQTAMSASEGGEAVSQQGGALDGEVLRNQEDLVQTRTSRIGPPGRQPSHEIVFKRWQDQNRRTCLSFEVRPVK